MTDPYPGFRADLALVVARTRHERYRLLTDPAAPEYNPGYIEVIRSEAARLRGEPSPPAAPSTPRGAKPHYKNLNDQIRATQGCAGCRDEAAAAKARREGHTR